MFIITVNFLEMLHHFKVYIRTQHIYYICILYYIPHICILYYYYIIMLNIIMLPELLQFSLPYSLIT